MKYLLFAGLVYSLGVCVHFLWEVFLIVRNNLVDIPECRRWWCPDGLRNRFLARKTKGEQ